jgi:hypothetical protein
MSDYRERCNEAKARRAGIVDQRPPPNRSKKAKPVVVEYRVSEETLKRHDGKFWRNFREWRKWHSYRTIEEAQKAIDNDVRKNHGLWEFRIKP